MHDDSLVKKIYRSEICGHKVRRQPPSKEGKVREYIGEGTQEGVWRMEHAREGVYLDREAWQPFCRGYPSGGDSLEREMDIRDIR